MEYFFKAGETTIELRHAAPRMRRMKTQDWIIAKTRHSSRDLQISFTTYNYTNTSIPAAWDALVRAGAIPIGPTPAGDFRHARPKYSELTSEASPRIRGPRLAAGPLRDRERAQHKLRAPAPP